MEDSNSTNLIIIIVLLIFLIGIGIFSFSLKLTSKNKENKVNSNSSDEIINSDTSIDSDSNIYKSYNLGESIVLNDNSSWHVIENSTSNEDEITILSDNEIGKISTKNVENYLEEIYYNELQENLGASDNAISVVRLLDIDDIMSITKISNIVIGSSIDNQDIAWLYKETTLTSYISDGIPILICKPTENNSASLCEGIGSDIFPVRPVITIKKSYIAK